MLPTGIFVKTELDMLISSLPDRLIARGPSRLTVDVEPKDSDADEQSFLGLSQWSDEWCFIEIRGPVELASLVVESVVKHEPVSEVLSCHFLPEEGEFSYALFRDGLLLESFESSGPSIETVNFTSELRRVPIQNLLRASDFMIDALCDFGIDSSMSPIAEVRKVVFHVNLPGKRTFWQMLLGAASSR
jgi:hypothetical protein